jgi:hypothetical protein
MLAAEALANLGECRALWVGEAESRRKMRTQNSILRDQVFAL